MNQHLYKNDHTRTHRWAWAALWIALIGMLLWASTTEKRRDPAIETKIDPCAVVLTESGRKCQ